MYILSIQLLNRDNNSKPVHRIESSFLRTAQDDSSPQ